MPSVNDDDDDDDDDDDNKNTIFFCQMMDWRKTLFPDEIIVRDPHHSKFLTYIEQYLSMC